MADYTSLANVKQWLQLAPGDTSNDPLLNRLITAASDFVRSWTSRELLSISYSEVRDGQGGTRLMFGDYPVTAVASVKIGQSSVPASVNGQSGYVFDATKVTLLGSYCFPRAQSNVTLNYTAGFSTIPGDVEQAVIEMVGGKFKGMDRIDVTSKTLAGEMISFSQKDMNAYAKTTLMQYKKVIPV